MTFNPLWGDDTITLASSTDTYTLEVNDKCSVLRIYPVYGVPLISINSPSNLPLLRAYEPLELENIDGQIRRLHLSCEAACEVNIKQLGAETGLRTRVGVDS